MGFDIECIIDILTYPGEYFCPVCRTLVYPNEALQSQCTHLYCKPCLAHVANNTRACPYDGYLVTEADSKPLLESDKTLAENIGKVKVRCLYHRSGCTWEGPLSECTSHCSGCTFGNSPVICNRCGVQIVHRQVHDHAQNCPGAYQVQQAAEAAPNAASSGPMVAPTSVNQSQAAVQSVAPSSQAHNSQTVPAPVQPGQDVNQQTNASSQAPATAPTPEQWYQQYYQQYGGYDLSQHGYQQYYPYQQSAVQHQQQPPAVHGGQPQLQAYSQAPQAQMPPQSQSQVQPLPHSQSQPQQLVQPLTGQPQAQAQQGFSQHIAHAQSLNPQTQNQPQSTLQQHAHPSMQPHAQIPSQPSVPHGFPTPQAQVHLMQPQSHVPGASYQHSQPSQVHLQPHLMTQPQPPSQPQQPPHLQHQTHPQIRPSQPNQPTALNIQAQPMHTSATVVTGFQSYPQPQLPQQAQTGASQQPPVHAQPTSGSVAPGQLHGQIPQQPSMFIPPPSHGLIPSQQTSFPSQGQLPSMPPGQQQQFHPQALHPSHSIQQRPLAQQYVQQQAPPGLVPGQFHQQGNLAVQQPVPSQLRPQGPPHVMHPNPQSHLHLQQNVAVVPGVQPQQTHNYVGRPGVPIQGAPGQPMPPFPQTYGGYGSAAPAKPALAQHYVHTVSNQPQMASDHQFGHPVILQRQGDHGSEKTAAGFEAGLPSQTVEKVANTSRPDTDGPNVLKSEAGISFEQDLKGTSNDQSKQNGLLTSTGAGERKEASAVPLSELKREKEESNPYLSEPPPNDKSGQLANKKDINSDTYNEELESQKSQKALLNSEDENLHSTRAVSPSSVSKPDGYKHANPERSQQASVDARDQSQPYNHEQHMNYYGPSISQRNSSGPPTLQTLPSYGEVPGHQARPHGPGPLLQPRNPMNPGEQLQPPDVPFGGVPTASSVSSFGGGPGYFGAPRGPPSAPIDHRDGIMGRGPQHGSDGQFASPNFGNPIEAEMMQSQGLTRFDGGQSKIPGTFGRGPFGPPSSGEQSSFRMDGGARVDSSLRPQDERFKTFPGDHLKRFPKEAPWTLDQDKGPRAYDRPPHGVNYDSGLNMGSVSGGPPRGSFYPPGDPHFSDARERGKMENERAHQEFIGSGRDYPSRPPHGFPVSSTLHGRDDIDGREIHSFGEGSRPYNLPSDPLGNSFHENRFPPLPSFPRRGEFDGPENLRFVEHVSGPPHNHLRRVDPFGQDIPPSHFQRSELGPGNSPSHLRFGDPSSFGPFPGHARMGEFSGPGNLPRDIRYGESFIENKLNFPPRMGEPGFRSSFSQGFLNDGPFRGVMEPFDKSRKRKPVSMGWCRICKVDCETVEGLDVHSQSREHQKMTMDLVISIKQQNKKKMRVSSDRAVREETNSKTRNAGAEGRGIKPRDPVIFSIQHIFFGRRRREKRLTVQHNGLQAVFFHCGAGDSQESSCRW